MCIRDSYNTTGIDILICDAWTFQDNDTDSFGLADGYTVFVPAGGYAVLGRSANPKSNGDYTADYAYSTGMQLANGGDELVLFHGALEIDRIEYDNGVSWPDPTGASFALDPSTLNGTDNDDGGNWCTSITAYGDGDKGTPGLENDACF